MAALLQSVKDDKDKSAIYLAECRRMGIKVLPPDVNESEGMFTPIGEDIRYGLGAIRNVGDNVVRGIVEARAEHGKASDFNEFLDNVPLVVCNKRVIESLIKAGAFDSMGHTRRALMECFERRVDEVIDLKRNQANGQDDLFGDFGSAEKLTAAPVPDLAEWDKRVRLGFEREMLGLYVSDHPLQGLEHILAAQRDCSIGQLRSDDGPRDGMVTIAGMITSVVRKQTKNGDLWAIATVEDLESSVEVLLFPKVYAAVASALASDTVVRIKGRVRTKDDAVELTGQEVTFPDVSEGPSGPAGDPAAGRPLHAGGDRAAAPGAAVPPGFDGGAGEAAVDDQRQQGVETRRGPAGGAVASADGRPEGPAGSVLRQRVMSR